ncbi:hypothetical protein [Deinococcus humi]|uniref:Oligosaccharide repeat unit polymerase n=1 Tax=Deinococcus humi TaxID=662880 RepID=A0A7W8ND40_9DEIO|nr:hypothetical protein [Deinococcus humi]MBB5361215.1 hypothetical protein [Deinococcus humi]
MLELISLFHLCLCSSILLFAGKMIASGRPSLLAVTAIGFILIDSLGITFAPYLRLSDIEYLNNPTFLINEKNADLYLLQVSAHWIFFFFVLFGLILEVLQKPKNIIRRTITPGAIKLFSGLLIMLGLIFYFRYFIIGPGLNILLNSRITFSSTSEAIAQRLELRYNLENGQGSYLASLASKIIFPLSVALLIGNKIRLNILIWLMGFSLSAIYAFQTREKAPLIAIFVLYSALFLWNRIASKNVNTRSIFRLAIPAALVFFIGGAIFYSLNFGLDFSAAITAIVARTIAIPGTAETNFFFVFPEIYDFRGLANIFRIGLLGYGGQDTSIYEVAVAATGDAFATNASMLAVAWSGAGYFGVIIISFILTSIIYLIDYFLARSDFQIFVLSAILSMPALVGLTSGSVIDYMSWGGVVSPVLLIIMSNLHSLTFKRRKYVGQSS